MTMSDPQGGEYIRVPLLTPSRSGLCPSDLCLFNTDLSEVLNPRALRWIGS